MERIVSLPGGERVVLKGTLVEDAWDVFIRKHGGHREVSFKNAVIWEEMPDRAADDWATHIANTDDPIEAEKRREERELEAAERRERQRKKNAQMAKQKCRWLIKCHGLNELLTITYRENQEDRELCKVHFKEWVRRMKVALGGEFTYVASFEKQDRGAMHVHVACHKLPKHAVLKGTKIEAWRLGTEVWRAIVGKDNGLCFVGGKKAKLGRSRNIQMSIAKLAGYVSKYIMKDYALSPLEKNRYSRSNGMQGLPKAEKIRIVNATFSDMVELAFQCDDGHLIVSHRLSRDQFGERRYWLVTEPDLGVGRPAYAH